MFTWLRILSVRRQYWRAYRRYTKLLDRRADGAQLTVAKLRVEQLRKHLQALQPDDHHLFPL